MFAIVRVFCCLLSLARRNMAKYAAGVPEALSQSWTDMPWNEKHDGSCPFKMLCKPRNKTRE